MHVLSFKGNCRMENFVAFDQASGLLGTNVFPTLKTANSNLVDDKTMKKRRALNFPEEK